MNPAVCRGEPLYEKSCSTFGPQVSCATTRAYGDNDELKELKDITLKESTVSELSRMKLPAVLAAFLVSYENRMKQTFSKMKACILEFLYETLVTGPVFIDNDEEDAGEIIDEMTDAICSNVSDGSSETMGRSVTVPLSSFTKRKLNAR